MGTHTMPMERTEIAFEDVADKMQEVYDGGAVPVICGANEERATALTTFWTYATAVTALECKALVGLSMNEGKPACWERIRMAGAGAMKAGNTLVFLMRDACPDLAGFAKESGGEEAFANMFTASVAKEPASFPGLDLEPGDVRDEFKVCVVSEFLAEDIEDFFEWGPIPLEKCHLLVVKE